MNQIKKALEILHSGDVIGFPTETVYGLAGRIDRTSAIKKIFAIKERPFFDPLIVHISSLEQAKSLVDKWPPLAEVLAQAFWPGPLTMVLQKNARVDSLITAGLMTVGLRMPRHPMALQILQGLDCPLAAPSANKFGKTSPTTAAHVRSEFQTENLFVVDGGSCEVGIESTIVLIEESHRLAILRPGQITQTEIAKILSIKQIPFEFFQISQAIAPGQMRHHYMPSVPFIILQNEPENLESLKIDIFDRMAIMPDKVENIPIRKPQKLENLQRLSLSQDPRIAAREFYGKLREEAEKKPDLIYFVQNQEMRQENWNALLDRMKKAASLFI